MASSAQLKLRASLRREPARFRSSGFLHNSATEHPFRVLVMSV